MRVSSLSDERIIRRLSRYFVPAWVSRDHYQLDSSDREEQAFVAKIDADRRKKKLEGGAVCVYIVTPKGEVLATLPVQKACKPELLVPFLKKVIADEKLKPRRPADVKGTPALAKPGAKTEGGRLFVVRTRFNGRDTRPITHWGVGQCTAIPIAAPGKYTVKFTVDGKDLTQPFEIIKHQSPADEHLLIDNIPPVERQDEGPK